MLKDIFVILYFIYTEGRLPMYMVSRVLYSLDTIFLKGAKNDYSEIG